MSRSASALLTLVIAIAGVSHGAAQAPSFDPWAAPSEPGTSAISGVTVDGAIGQPLAGVVVYLGPPQHGPPGAPLRVVTDARGRFVFPRLPAYDGYFIHASKPGYLDGVYGRANTNGARITVAKGQWVPDIRVLMNRPGSISGTVLDDHNQPVVAAAVRVLRQIPVAGEMQLAAGPVATTDDLGVYRIAGLIPGSYYVQVAWVRNAPASSTAPAAPAHPTAPRSGDGAPRVYPIRFFPSASTLDAAMAVTVAAGESRAGIDLQLAPVVGRTITGRIESPLSAAGLTLRLMLPGAESLADGSAAATATVDAGGRFRFEEVPPGAYVIDGRDAISEYQFSVRGGSVSLPGTPGTAGICSDGQGSLGVSSGPTGTSLFHRAPTSRTGLGVRQPITVGAQDLNDVVVRAQRGGTISGRFVLEGAARLVADALRASPAHGTASLGFREWRGTGRADGTFVPDGLMPGEYVLESSLFLKSVICAGKDYSFRIFDMSVGDVSDCVVTLTSESSAVSGTVRDDRGQGRPDAAAVIFPVEPSRWAAMGLRPPHIKSAQATNTGAFRLQGLRAGDYFLIALPAEQVDAWQEPGFLAAAAPLATRIRLGQGETANVDVKVATIRWPK